MHVFVFVFLSFFLCLFYSFTHLFYFIISFYFMHSSYVKPFESALCMKSAILIKLPCLALPSGRCERLNWTNSCHLSYYELCCCCFCPVSFLPADLTRSTGQGEQLRRRAEVEPTGRNRRPASNSAFRPAGRGTIRGCLITVCENNSKPICGTTRNITVRRNSCWMPAMHFAIQGFCVQY